MSFSGFFPPTFDLSSEEAMTRRQRENLYLVFWIGVVSVELAVMAREVPVGLA